MTLRQPQNVRSSASFLAVHFPRGRIVAASIRPGVFSGEAPSCTSLQEMERKRIVREQVQVQLVCISFYTDRPASPVF
jgi:hypothetical protein